MTSVQAQPALDIASHRPALLLRSEIIEPQRLARTEPACLEIPAVISKEVERKKLVFPAPRRYIDMVLKERK